MNGNVLDTNVIIRYVKGDAAVAAVVENLENIAIPSVVIGELLFGAEKSQRREYNRKVYLDFCAPYPVLDVTATVADEYGTLKCNLQKSGHILPENDMWIAATAIANGMAVVTQDKHFSCIDGLSVVAA